MSYAPKWNNKKYEHNHEYYNHNFSCSRRDDSRMLGYYTTTNLVLYGSSTINCKANNICNLNKKNVIKIWRGSSLGNSHLESEIKVGDNTKKNLRK